MSEGIEQIVSNSAIPKVLYRGTSYHQLRLLTYPKRPIVERILKSRTYDFHLVDDYISAMLMAAEAASNDRSIAAIVVVKDMSFVEVDAPPKNGTYKDNYLVLFEELKPCNMEIWLEGRELFEKLHSCDPALTPSKLSKMFKRFKEFSRSLKIMVPEHLPQLEGKGIESRVK